MPFRQEPMVLQHIERAVLSGLGEVISGERKIGLVSARPDYSQAFMQEQVLPMYFKKNLITPDFYSKSYLECQRDF
jgi:hypothetical protein